MNFEFLQKLDQAKTLENAKTIEALKNMYIMCELKNDPDIGEEGTMKYLNDQKGLEYNGRALSDTCYEFSGKDGTVKLSVVDSNTVLIESSPTGTDEMYHTVGKVNVDTSLDDALEIGFKALGNDTLVESWFGNMVGKTASTAALAAAPYLAGCAGTTQEVPPMPEVRTSEYINDEYGVNNIEGNAIPTLVAEITRKLAEQATENEADNFSVATVPAAIDAKKIYDMLDSGEIIVDPNIDTHAAATAFSRGIRQELHNKLKANGVDELLKELN